MQVKLLTIPLPIQQQFASITEGKYILRTMHQLAVDLAAMVVKSGKIEKLAQVKCKLSGLLCITYETHTLMNSGRNVYLSRLNQFRFLDRCL